VHFEHDASGRLVRGALPHPSQSGWITHTSYEYSPDGNLVAARDPLGNVIRYEYSGHLMVRETNRNTIRLLA
jgi:YD repeat-containing protein